MHSATSRPAKQGSMWKWSAKASSWPADGASPAVAATDSACFSAGFPRCTSTKRVSWTTLWARSLPTWFTLAVFAWPVSALRKGLRVALSSTDISTTEKASDMALVRPSVGSPMAHSAPVDRGATRAA